MAPNRSELPFVKPRGTQPQNGSCDGGSPPFQKINKYLMYFGIATYIVVLKILCSMSLDLISIIILNNIHIFVCLFEVAQKIEIVHLS